MKIAILGAGIAGHSYALDYAPLYPLINIVVLSEKIHECRNNTCVKEVNKQAPY